MQAGKPVTVDVLNATDTPELVHWHGFLIPAELDGVEEQGTPFIPPQKDGTPGRARYTFTPGPTGSRWYHSHAMAYADLHKGSYTGQFGFVMVESNSDSGQYDQEIFLALRDWEPFYTRTMEDDDDEDPSSGTPEKPEVLNTDPNGLEVNSVVYSINDKSLGAGEPIRVKEGQRVLFRLLNASAIENRRISFSGHKFKVLALDGNPVPTPALVETLFLGAGERIDALVEMNNPGVWVLGAPEDSIRNAGLGILVEYANQHKQPQWLKPANLRWDYSIFGNAATDPAQKPADQTIEMIFEKIPAGAAAKFNTWLVNGKPYPHANEFVLKQGLRYRLVFRNRTDDAHPLHLHRHQLEIVEINGKKNLRRHQGHRHRPLLRPRRRRVHRQPTRPHPLPLPHPAAHGLRLQGPLPLRLTSLPGCPTQSLPTKHPTRTTPARTTDTTPKTPTLPQKISKPPIPILHTELAIPAEGSWPSRTTFSALRFTLNEIRACIPACQALTHRFCRTALSRRI